MKQIIYLFSVPFLAACFLVGCQSPFFEGPTEVTRFIGWKVYESGSKKEEWDVVSFNVRFEHEKFNLTNADSNLLIDADVSVAYSYNGVSNYLSETILPKVYINQRYIKDESRVIGLIEIIPLFSKHSHKIRQGEKHEKFSKRRLLKINLKEPIRTRGFGKSYFRIKLGNKQIDLETVRRK